MRLELQCRKCKGDEAEILHAHEHEQLSKRNFNDVRLPQAERDAAQAEAARWRAIRDEKKKVYTLHTDKDHYIRRFHNLWERCTSALAMQNKPTDPQQPPPGQPPPGQPPPGQPPPGQPPEQPPPEQIPDWIAWGRARPLPVITESSLNH
jgi:hypothetical protein